jgi:uncharacterized protein (DUF924 family)
MTKTYLSIINFWFKDTTPEQKWRKDVEFDKLIINKFSVIHTKASNGKLKSWRTNSYSALAEIIILDQFSRNMFRNSPLAFANDALALQAAQEAVNKGYDKELSAEYKSFLYMPFMHSESTEIHEIAEKLFNQKGLEKSYESEIKHKRIIDRFGRYPHRNKILGRKSTTEEKLFLTEPDSSF